MSKTYKFYKRDKNRFRKIYNFVRRKPVFEYTSKVAFTIIAGTVTFSNSAGPVIYTYTDGDPTVSFANVPVVTGIAVDSVSQDAADVNVFITAVTTVNVQFSASAPFTGEVHFQIITQD